MIKLLYVNFLNKNIFFSHFCSESYLREMAAAAHLQLAASGTAFAGGSTSGATISPANAAAAMAAASAVTAEAAHGSHKRPRMDLTSTHPSSASNTAGASSGSTTGSNAISHPLTIDTREAVKVRRQKF